MGKLNVRIKLLLFFTTLLLDEGVPYNVSIAAVNSVGLGEAKYKLAFSKELSESSVG